MASIKQVPLFLSKRTSRANTVLFTIGCKRDQSTSSIVTQIARENNSTSRGRQAKELQSPSGLERLPASSLLRNLLLGYFITTPVLFRPGFSILRKIANSKSRILNPDANPLLRAFIKPLIYDQFCAGRNRTEICETKQTIKSMGYSGVILGYGKELQVTPNNSVQLLSSRNTEKDAELEAWAEGNLRTLDMIGDGDWLAIKCTGAGTNLVGAMMRNEELPSKFHEAMDAVCEKARSKNCRVIIDAEQQVVQKAIDKLTIDLMRKFNNKDDKALVFNSLQAYLKAARDNLKDQLALASKEGWTLGIKLVRGAYISNDQREAIHDTKADTDNCYNSIVRDLVGGSNLGVAGEKFPNVQLFLAGHNPESIASAMDLVRKRTQEGSLKVLPDFGQLQGMGDNLGCRILQQNEDLKKNTGSSAVVPQVYKYLTWGTVQECMQYLIRRVVENQGGTDRMRDGLSSYVHELKRRVLWR